MGGGHGKNRSGEPGEHVPLRHQEAADTVNGVKKTTVGGGTRAGTATGAEDASRFIATTVVGPTTLGGDAVLALEDERQFFWLLDEALRRIVAFYGARLAGYLLHPVGFRLSVCVCVAPFMYTF